MISEQFVDVSTRSRPKAADSNTGCEHEKTLVSTRSRPKAAENPNLFITAFDRCFNTQPPEGG